MNEILLKLAERVEERELIYFSAILFLFFMNLALIYLLKQGQKEHRKDTELFFDIMVKVPDAIKELTKQQAKQAALLGVMVHDQWDRQFEHDVKDDQKR